VPNSFEDVGVAIGEVATRLNLTGKPLEEITKKFLDLSRITKTDVATNVANVTRVFGDAGIAVEDQAEALDKLFTATKQTGIGLDRLTTLTVNYGAPLRQLGFGLEESISIFAKWEKEGVNTEAVMAGMKIGLSNMARAGKEPVAAFKEVVAAIAAAGSAGEANLIAIETFGSRAGPDMAAAVREGRFEIDDMVASLQNTVGALDDAADATLSTNDRFKILTNQLVVAAAPAVEQLEKVTSLLVGALGLLPRQAQGVVVALGVLAIVSKSAGAMMLAFGKKTIGANVAMLGTKAGAKSAAGALGILGGIAMVAYAANAKKAADATKNMNEAVSDLSRTTDDDLVKAFINAQVATMFATDVFGGFDAAMTQLVETSFDSATRMLALEDASGGLTNQLIAGGKSADDAAEFVAKLRAAHEAETVALANLAKTQDANTASTEDATDAADEGTEAAKKLGKTFDWVAAKTEAHYRAMEQAETAADELREAEEKLISTNRELAGNVLDAEEATWSWIEAQAQATETAVSADSTMIDVARSLNDVVRATDTMVIANAGLTDETLATEAGLRTWVGGMQAAAAELNGPQKSAVLEHIARVAGVPAEKFTKIQALIDQGDLERAEELLNLLVRQRTATVTVLTAGGVRQADARADIGLDPGLQPGPAFFGAAGGLVTRPTNAVIGESGPELVLPVDRGALDGSPGSSKLSSLLGGGISEADIAAMTAAVERGVVAGFKGIRQAERAS